MKIEIATVIAKRVKAWNWEACKFFYTYWIKTKAFIMKNTQ